VSTPIAGLPVASRHDAESGRREERVALPRQRVKAQTPRSSVAGRLGAPSSCALADAARRLPRRSGPRDIRMRRRQAARPPFLFSPVQPRHKDRTRATRTRMADRHQGSKQYAGRDHRALARRPFIRACGPPSQRKILRRWIIANRYQDASVDHRPASTPPARCRQRYYMPSGRRGRTSAWPR